MNFYKNGKDTYFCDNPRYIIAKTFCKEWAIYKATDTPGQFAYVCTYKYLKDAKAEVKRLHKQEVKQCKKSNLTQLDF